MIKKNLFASYFVQIYSALINVTLIPTYVSILGIEKYGLIGIFMLLQSMLMILDAGISGALTRQASISKQHISSYKYFLKQFSVILFVFTVISVFIFTFGYVNSNYIIVEWIKSSLGEDILRDSVVLMFIILSLRYVTNPFRSGLVGLEKYTTLSKLDFIFISLKLPGGLIILKFFYNSLSLYFTYQAFLSLIELFVLAIIFTINSKFIVSNKVNSTFFPKKNITIKSLLVFSGQLSLLSIAWIVVTQVDKLILSKVLSLTEYSYYTIAVALSGVILMFSAPISQILMTRLSVLYSQNKMQEYVELYKNSFSVIIIMVMSLGIFIFIFSKSIIYIWTGDMVIANASYFYAKWLALGNSISVLLTFIFLLQYSLNRLKKHVVVYFFYSLLLIPTSIYIANEFKGNGAAIFWLIHNAVFFIIWGSVVNNEYIKGINCFLWVEILIPTVVISSIFFYYANINIDFMLMSKLKIGVVLFIIGTIDILLIFLYLFISRKRIIGRSNNIIFTHVNVIYE